MLGKTANNVIVYQFGFGGCSAPTRPMPVKAPGFGQVEGDGEDRSRDSSGDDAVVLYLGFGGCRAPERPTPLYLPGIERSSERRAA